MHSLLHGRLCRSQTFLLRRQGVSRTLCNLTLSLPARQCRTGVPAMEAMPLLFLLLNLLIFLPLQLYGLIRGINVQRYNLGIAKGRRYTQGFWWRQASALARSRASCGVNFVITTVLAALGVIISLMAGAWLDGAICSYVLINGLVAANFFATQLPIIDAEQAERPSGISNSAAPGDSAL